MIYDTDSFCFLPTALTIQKLPNQKGTAPQIRDQMEQDFPYFSNIDRKKWYNVLTTCLHTHKAFYKEDATETFGFWKIDPTYKGGFEQRSRKGSKDYDQKEVHKQEPKNEQLLSSSSYEKPELTNTDKIGKFQTSLKNIQM